MALHVQIEGRDFQVRAALPLNWSVDSLSWSAAGGAQQASISAQLDSAQDPLVADSGWMENLLRCPVTVSDELGQAVWWGMVESVALQAGALCERISLASMANRVRVSYHALLPKQMVDRAVSLTGWVEDPASLAMYGRKEAHFNLPQATAQEAEQAAVTWLAGCGQPQRSFGLIRPAGGAQVRLECRGWWDTLGWVYWSPQNGQIGLTVEGGASEPLGKSSSSGLKLAQSFSVPSEGLNVAEVWLCVGKAGSPADNLKVELVADNSGSPGSAGLGSVQAGANTLAGGLNWVRFGFDAPVGLTGGASYWLVLSRTGAASTANYYLLRADESTPFAGGVLKGLDSSSWVLRTKDLNFALNGAQETTQQIARLAGQAGGGQFLNGVKIEVPSGVNGLLTRDTERTCLTELEDLLRVGTAGGRRLLAEVDASRVLVVREDTGSDSALFWVERDGSLRCREGRSFALSDPLAGRWVSLANGQPAWVKAIRWTAQGGLEMKVG